MAQKGAFWIGMVMSVGGVLVILAAGDRTWMHVPGVLLVLAGAGLALKNFRA